MREDVGDLAEAGLMMDGGLREVEIAFRWFAVCEVESGHGEHAVHYEGVGEC